MKIGNLAGPAVGMLVIVLVAPRVQADSAQLDILDNHTGWGLGGVEVNDVSGDGTTLIGNVQSPLIKNWEAFRYVVGDCYGVPLVPHWLDIAVSHTAQGVSGDGSVIVGAASEHAVIYTSSGWVSMPNPPLGVSGLSQALDVSSDGSTVVGYWGKEAIRWTLGGAVITLGHFQPWAPNSAAYGVSGDGSVVVGESEVGLGTGGQAFVWRESTGMIDIGGSIPYPVGLPEPSVALEITPDGVYAVGHAYASPDERAVRWNTVTEQALILGALPTSNPRAMALAVSADGSIVVGRSEVSAGGYRAFIWDAQHGMRELPALLIAEYGVTMPIGFIMAEATAISDDGLTIVGRGKWDFGNGPPAGWIVRFDPSGKLPQVPLPQWPFGEPVPPPADLNGDGVVNGFDLAQLLAQWGQCDCGCTGDLNGEGLVDGVDIASLLANWGSVR